MAFYNFAQIKATRQCDNDGLEQSICVKCGFNSLLTVYIEVTIKQTKTPFLRLNTEHIKKNVQNTFKERAVTVD